MAEDMFDGFDHTRHKDEVEQRWGKDAYAAGDKWWRSKTEADKKAFKDQHIQIAEGYAAARKAGLAPDSEAAQAVAARHCDWLSSTNPATDKPVSMTRFMSYGEMYVSDERFAANYGGPPGAKFVREAIRAFAERDSLHMSDATSRPVPSAAR